MAEKRNRLRLREGYAGRQGYPRGEEFPHQAPIAPFLEPGFPSIRARCEFLPWEERINALRPCSGLLLLSPGYKPPPGLSYMIAFSVAGTLVAGTLCARPQPALPVVPCLGYWAVIPKCHNGILSAVALCFSFAVSHFIYLQIPYTHYWYIKLTVTEHRFIYFGKITSADRDSA